MTGRDDSDDTIEAVDWFSPVAASETIDFDRRHAHRTRQCAQNDEIENVLQMCLYSKVSVSTEPNEKRCVCRGDRQSSVAEVVSGGGGNLGRDHYLVCMIASVIISVMQQLRGGHRTDLQRSVHTQTRNGAVLRMYDQSIMDTSAAERRQHRGGRMVRH